MAKLLGYELEHIKDDYYDATIVFGNEELINVITACDEEGYDIIALTQEKAIVEKHSIG